jgi:hypothetical protein
MGKKVGTSILLISLSSNNDNAIVKDTNADGDIPVIFSGLLILSLFSSFKKPSFTLNSFL